MKRFKNLVLAACLSTVALTSACLCSKLDFIKTDASENKNAVATIYEYALLGETYKIKEDFDVHLYHYYVVYY